MKLLFLGTGTSHGVPSIDCMLNNFATCPKGVCSQSSSDPRHRRTRSSVLLRCAQQNILIDVSPDFREQMLRERVGRIDAVLLTHKHSDHIGGVADIRSYTRSEGSALNVYGSAETLDSVKKRYDYVFDPTTFVGGGIPRLNIREIDGPFLLAGVPITPLPVVHGPLQGCFGYRIGSLAYIPDIKAIAQSSLDLLKGVDTLVLNCLRVNREHSTHMILEQSLALARQIAPRVCWFIHMCHDIHYVDDKPMLDSWMDFAWDGLEIEIPDC